MKDYFLWLNTLNGYRKKDEPCERGKKERMFVAIIQKDKRRQLRCCMMVGVLVPGDCGGRVLFYLVILCFYGIPVTEIRCATFAAIFFSADLNNFTS